MLSKHSLRVLPETFALCRLDTRKAIPAWAFGHEFLSITRTPDELSVVLPQERVPKRVKCQRDFRAFEVAGPLDFDQVGVLASVAAPLAQAGVSIFAISTYDTDYIFVRQENLSKAIQALRAAGHAVEDPN